MGLALSAVRHAGQQFAEPVTTPLPQGRCTIGRGDDADITLEDPTRHISRAHAAINGHGDVYILSVESRVNPVYVNGSALSVGQTRILVVGDELAVGDYVLHVVGDGAAAARAPAIPALAATLPPQPSLGRSSPLDDILGALPARGSPALAPAPFDSLLGGPPTVAPAFNDILDGLGGLAGPGESARMASPAAPAALFNTPGGAASMTALFGVSSTGLLDSLGSGGGADPLGLNRGARVETGSGFSDGGRGLDHVHPVNQPFTPPPVAGGRAPTAKAQPAIAPAPTPVARTAAPIDILSQFGVNREAPGNTGADPLGILGVPATKPPVPMPAVELPEEERTGISKFVPPLEVSAAVAAAAPVAAVYAAPLPTPAGSAPVANGTGSGGAAAAAAILLQGAGIDGVTLGEAEAAQFLAECGALCRASVEGVVALLLARATMRKELRAADRTQLAATENNPLKMMESPEEAIQFVFDPASRTEGFLPPDQAFADAFKDLQTHEIAIMAGMRSALMGSIKRFEPPNIEKRHELATRSKTSLLSNRKALLWDFFVEFHAKTTDDAQDNFDRVFGADFIRAYMEQVRRLK